MLATNVCTPAFTPKALEAALTPSNSMDDNGETEIGLGKGYTKWARSHYNVMIDIKTRGSWDGGEGQTS